LKPWMSDKDLPKGTRWNAEIGDKLGTSTVGVFCLTPDNLAAPWLNFEAGAVSNSVKDARVFTYLFEVKYDQVDYPLAQFNHTRATEAETLKMLQDINMLLLPDLRVNDSRLERLFANCWPRLEEKFKAISQKMAEAKTEPKVRSSEDMLSELLELTRGLAKRVPEYVQGSAEGKLPGNEPGLAPRSQQGELPSEVGELGLPQSPQEETPSAKPEKRKKKKQ